MEIPKLSEFDGHKLVSFFYDEPTGLKGFVAIHNNNLGPATGGTRYFEYQNETDALKDALNLSRAMTYKCALAGVPYGGSKVVIMADPKKPKTPKFLQAYARVINLFNGQVTTGEDIGMTQADIDYLAEYSPFINGRSKRGGDLSPWAALGVFHATEAALEFVFNSSSLKNKTFAIKGLGKVGTELAKLIYKHGGQVVGADINKSKITAAKKRFPKIKIVEPKEIHKQKVDVFAPCALGCEINQKTILEFNCPIICGAANNQLCKPEDGMRIHKKGILYIPDYLANAGGLINVAGELRKSGYSRKWVENKCKEIKSTTLEILKIAKKRNLSTSLVANQLAEKAFKNS